MTRHITTFVAGFTILLATFVPVIAAQPQPKASNDDAAQLKTALEERIKVSTDVRDFVEAQFRVGAVDLSLLIAVEKDLWHAELDSCDEPAKKISLLEKHLKKADDLQQMVEARCKAGTVTQADCWRAKVDYLNVTIQLLRERLKGKATHTAE